MPKLSRWGKKTAKCPTCGNAKDYRARVCRKCAGNSRLGTGRGWRISANGYIVRAVRGKDIYQHRWVMEQHLKRRLKRDECVHHKNHDRTDNRIENLELLMHSEHAKHHATPEKMKKMSKLAHKSRWKKRRK